MTREIGKKLWGFLLRKRDVQTLLFVILDEGDRRALSIAYGIADALGLDRSHTIWKVDQTDWRAKLGDVPPNRHVFEMTKATRYSVV